MNQVNKYEALHKHNGDRLKLFIRWYDTITIMDLEDLLCNGFLHGNKDHVRCVYCKGYNILNDKEVESISSAPTNKKNWKVGRLSTCCFNLRWKSFIAIK